MLEGPEFTLKNCKEHRQLLHSICINKNRNYRKKWSKFRQKRKLMKLTVTWPTLDTSHPKKIKKAVCNISFTDGAICDSPMKYVMRATVLIISIRWNMPDGGAARLLETSTVHSPSTSITVTETAIVNVSVRRLMRRFGCVVLTLNHSVNFLVLPIDLVKKPLVLHAFRLCVAFPRAAFLIQYIPIGRPFPLLFFEFLFEIHPFLGL
mmetsp:Transcript_24675/g.29802  ORF Transcript_24675/g.29802 Transcript_24675/m.29802 type:complete len:207 (+) Transcript_24675:46-666(+)